jgi:hypothetical protein
MARPRLIYRDEDYANFLCGWYRCIVEQRFELIPYEPGRAYPQDHAIYTTYQQDYYNQNRSAWFRELESRGHRVVIDHLLDGDVDMASELDGSRLTVRSPHWMWYSTAIRAVHDGYHTYRPNTHLTHDFLMLMNKQREHRDRIAAALSPELVTARWSYVERDRPLDDPTERSGPVFWEFYMNPQWYDSTRFSVVVESWMRSDAHFRSPTGRNYKTEVSEKIYKPLAWFHPFVVAGSIDTLKFIRSQGFETFDHLWSESYDSITTDSARLDAVIDLVRDVVKQHNCRSGAWDSITWEKLQHNHHRFFDQRLVVERFHREILDEIEAFVCA